MAFTLTDDMCLGKRSVRVLDTANDELLLNKGIDVCHHEGSHQNGSPGYAVARKVPFHPEHLTFALASGGSRVGRVS